MAHRTNQTPAIIVISSTGISVAKKISSILPKSETHGLVTRFDGADIVFKNTQHHLQALFQSKQPIIGLCGTGILIRSLAPVLQAKKLEPPVIAVAQDASVAVPLLGSHNGGNKLARQISEALGSHLAITTASEAVLGIALDEPPAGYHLQNPHDLKAFTAQILSGASVQVKKPPSWIKNSHLPISDTGSLKIDCGIEVKQGGPEKLVFSEEVLTLGVGCERDCNPDELKSLVEETLNRANISAKAISVVVSLDLKCDEPAVLELGKFLNRPVRFLDSKRLESETRRIRNPSEIVFQAVGCHGVAESAALAAAGQNSDLLIEKQKSKRATCAIGRSTKPINALEIGRGRGQLAIVGLGPGNLEWRTLEAQTLLSSSSDIVGYSGYLEQLGPSFSSKKLHPFPLGKEIERVDTALDLAATGRSVSLVSSGDPGIYAMGALVFERLGQIADSEWKWIDIIVSPGISAIQAAAARIGAPLGHDFCAISLSDLLTPTSSIKKRLKAAASSDFVVALYNPASKKRTSLLRAALEIMAQHRAPETPLIVARQIGRPSESLYLSTLGRVDPNRVDMFSILLIGSTQTRKLHFSCLSNWVYTPRGYSTKVRKNS